jgi:enoyl-CoA hydratase/carnithine racemase
MDEVVVTSREDGVRVIQLNRPDKKNALTLAMYTALAEALTAGEADDTVAAFVITGTPGCFTSGNDLADFLTLASLADTPITDFLTALTRTSKPIVAAVEGPAVGIGSTMLLHCDLVYAAANTRFQFPFVNLGLVPEAASSLLLPRLMGHQRAAKLLMLGEPFTAETALELGIINEIVATDALLATALDVAAKLALKPRAALARTKALLKGDTAQVAERMAEEVRAFDVCLKSDALREAVTAFRERRPPDFSRCG